MVASLCTSGQQRTAVEHSTDRTHNGATHAEEERESMSEENTPIVSDVFHFVTVTDEGLEILPQIVEPSEDDGFLYATPRDQRTVINDPHTLRALMYEVEKWIQARTCPSLMLEYDGTRQIWCQLTKGHEEMHFGRRLTPDMTEILGYCYWADGNGDNADQTQAQ